MGTWVQLEKKIMKMFYFITKSEIPFCLVHYIQRDPKTSYSNFEKKSSKKKIKNVDGIYVDSIL